jgi:hypothetical protein
MNQYSYQLAENMKCMKVTGDVFGNLVHSHFTAISSQIKNCHSSLRIAYNCTEYNIRLTNWLCKWNHTSLSLLNLGKWQSDRGVWYVKCYKTCLAKDVGVSISDRINRISGHLALELQHSVLPDPRPRLKWALGDVVHHGDAEPCHGPHGPYRPHGPLAKAKNKLGKASFLVSRSWRNRISKAVLHQHGEPRARRANISEGPVVAMLNSV